jgi:acetyl-CoA carboxylase biotin carboxyl carrier protein
MNADSLDLIARRAEDGGWELCAPTVGLYASAPERGCRRGPGEAAGCLLVLDRRVELRLPTGVAGFVDTAPPERRHLPAEYGQVLFRLVPDAEAAPVVAAAEAEAAAGLVVRSPQAGRFWRRPDPDSPAFAADGEALRAGRTLGLLEVMKTFNPVKYAPGGGLPETASVRRFLVEDGQDVEEGQPLLELEA